MTLATETPELLITYDISDNKKRKKLYQFLNGYGIPLQKSVFLCTLKQVQQMAISQELKKIKLDITDSIHCFYVNESAYCPSPSPIFRLNWIID